MNRPSKHLISRATIVTPRFKRLACISLGVILLLDRVIADEPGLTKMEADGHFPFLIGVHWNRTLPTRLTGADQCKVLGSSWHGAVIPFRTADRCEILAMVLIERSKTRACNCFLSVHYHAFDPISFSIPTDETVKAKCTA